MLGELPTPVCSPSLFLLYSEPISGRGGQAGTRAALGEVVEKYGITSPSDFGLSSVVLGE